MVTGEPKPPVVTDGENPVMVGAARGVTVNTGPVTTPAGVTTVIGPVVAPPGTFTVICVGESMLKNCASTPLKNTLLAPVKFVPVMTTCVPGAPVVGVTALMVGALALVTVKLLALVPAPPL